MSEVTERILRELSVVQRLREEHALDAAQRDRVTAVKDFQSRRFARGYADLLEAPRYRSATRFFLDELYGPFEFADRDMQFARVVPSIVRLFPTDLAATVERLAELHALSEGLDDTMARHLADGKPIDAATYIRAWQATGQPGARRRQIALTLAVGQALDHYTRRRLIRATLHMMRTPARAAGLGALQRFLEAGFDAFGAMNGAAEFLATIDAREQAFADAVESPAALAWARGCAERARWPHGGALESLP